MSKTDDFLSLKAINPVTIHTGEDIRLVIDHHDAWRAEVPKGRHTLALYANIRLPRPGTRERMALARGGWRAWFQQHDVVEGNHRDETGYLGYVPVSSHAPGHLLISHSWPHSVRPEAPWEFMIRLEAIGANGRRMPMPLTLSTREIKVLGEKP